MFNALGVSMGQERTLFFAPSELTGGRTGVLALEIFWLKVPWVIAVVEGTVKALVPLYKEEAGAHGH